MSNLPAPNGNETGVRNLHTGETFPIGRMDGDDIYYIKDGEEVPWGTIIDGEVSDSFGWEYIYSSMPQQTSSVSKECKCGIARVDCTYHKED